MDKRTFLKSVAVLAASPSIGGGARTSLGSPTAIAEWSLNMDATQRA